MTISIQEATAKPRSICEMRVGDYALVLEDYNPFKQGDVLLRLDLDVSRQDWKQTAAEILIIRNGKRGGTGTATIPLGSPMLTEVKLRILPPGTIISIAVLGDNDP